MNIFNIAIVIFLIVASVVVYSAIQKAAQTENKIIKPEMKNICYGDDLTCNPNLDCSLFNPTTIQRCTTDENGKKICNSCICQANSKLRGCMKCQESDPNVKEKRYEFNKSKNDCKDPLEWDEKEQVCVLSRGNFCLPTKINNPPCNKFTGRKLLVYDNDSGYSWKCFCKDNTKFSGSECDNINVCGLLGSKENPKNFSPNSQMGDYRGLYKKGEPNVFWSGSSDWNPLDPLDTECKCKYGEIVDNNRRMCLPNDCKPGIQKSSTNCECSKPFIDCESIAYTNDGPLAKYYNGVCKIPSCVPDPCGGPYGDSGSYNINTGKCECSPGFSLVPDPYSFTGQSCQKLCIDNGPCGSRGECKINIDKKGYTKFIISCYQNGQVCTKPPTFSIMYKDTSNNTEYYLNYDSVNKKLTFDTRIINGTFSIELKSCDNSMKNCSSKPLQDERVQLKQNGYYYLKMGDQYLTLTPDSNGNYNLVDSSRKEESLFRLLESENQFPDNIGYIYIDKSVKFLSIKKDSNGKFNVSFDPYTDKLEYCDNCYLEKGWLQDENLLCGNTCMTKGSSSRDYTIYVDPPTSGFSTRVDIEDKPTDENMKKSCCSGKYTTEERSENVPGFNERRQMKKFKFICS